MLNWIATHGATAGFIYTTILAVSIVWQGLVSHRRRKAGTPWKLSDRLSPFWQLACVWIGLYVIGLIQHHRI